jgi:ribosomal protein S11
MKTVEILVKGQGSGRETAIRAIEGLGLKLLQFKI